MRFRDVLGTALSNLTRHKARTALTTVGVVVGILTIVTMVSLGIGVQTEMTDAFGSVGLETVRLYPATQDGGTFDFFGQPARTQLLTPELVAELESREDVVEVIPFLRLPNSVRLTVIMNDQEAEGRPRGLQASSIPGPFEIPSETLAGVDEPPPSGGSVVLAQQILNRLGFEAGEYDSLIGRVLEIVLYAPRGESQVFPLKIAGIIDPSYDHRHNSVGIAPPDRLEMLKWWYNDPEYMAHRGYDELVIRAESLNAAAHIVDRLSNLGYGVQSLKAMLDLANRGMIIMQAMLGAVGGVALLVACIGIANTMIMAVYERTREIGILKAVGAAPGQIRALFVLEASLIGLLGGIVGTILGWLLGKLLNWVLLEIMRWQDVPMNGTFFVVSWWLIVGALIFATLVGLLAGLYPAARAARLAPLDALRYE